MVCVDKTYHTNILLSRESADIWPLASTVIQVGVASSGAEAWRLCGVGHRHLLAGLSSHLFLFFELVVDNLMI